MKINLFNQVHAIFLTFQFDLEPDFNSKHQ